MVESIFENLCSDFHPSVLSKEVSYYFSLGEVKRSVTLTPEGCEVSPGKRTENADCVCKMDPVLFQKIWTEGYRPGLKDFLSGAIKSNDVEALKTFLKAFGKGE